MLAFYPSDALGIRATTHMLQRIVRGALLGTAAGFGLLAIGGIRIAVARASGQQFGNLSTDDLRRGVLYLAAFIVGGAVVGALGSRRHTRGGATLVGVVAAIPVMLGVGMAIFGWPSGWDGAQWFSFAAMVALFGPLVGYRDLYKPKLPQPGTEAPRLRTVYPSSRDDAPAP